MNMIETNKKYRSSAKRKYKGKLDGKFKTENTLTEIKNSEDGVREGGREQRKERVRDDRTIGVTQSKHQQG